MITPKEWIKLEIESVQTEMARVLIQQDDLDNKFRKLEYQRNALERELEALDVCKADEDER